MIRIAIVAGLVVSVFACKKSDPAPASATPDESGYLVVNNVVGAGFLAGNISLYKKAQGVLVNEAFQVGGKGSTESISDAVVSGDKLYVARSTSSIVDVVSLSSFQTLNSIAYSKGQTPNRFKHIEVTADKIFVSDRGFVDVATFDNASYLKVIRLDNSKVDSIPVMKNAAVWALAQANGKIFVSAGYLAQQSIFAFDATTYVKLAEVKLTSTCGNILVDKDNNILALTYKGMTKINGTDFSVMKDKNLFGVQINVSSNDYSTCNSAFSLDRDSNVLYYLTAAPQPAFAPYLLNSYDLSGDQVTMLTSNFISAQTVAFDQKEKVILIGDSNSSTGATGSAGLVNMYSTKGVLLKKVVTPNTPSKILVTP